jgi:GMP synthase-like glutamine amidotransferase
LKKILLIDNTFDPPHGSPEIRNNLEGAALALGLAIEVQMVRAPEMGIPLDLSGYHAVVLSGSKTRINENAPWITKEMEAIRDLHARKIPTLGICYGEQLIARALGGDACIGVAEKSEHGWFELELKSETTLLAGLPQKFFTFEFHSDEVKKLPPNFRLTASSPACPVQAYDLTDAPMWGIQFHPERGLAQGQQGLERRLKADPSFPAMNYDKAEELYDPSVAAVIFKNFLRQVMSARHA